ncbi:hypothetical protein [Veillonella sp. R32]|uniref:hypothetical protein n=1 Tax=Veillonella sp. R32 TaxID=2021312 RepID=UPI00138A39DB|nr:hypothetical protein [Veillonella sp. R32]KAF1679185.1 hypothetical protein VER_09595 [Veillonella sp. R32]
MKQAWVNMAVVMAISAPVWGIVPVSAADSAIPNVVQQEQLEMARQRAEARNERNQTKRVEIEGIHTSTDADNAVDETGPSFFITHIELGDENQTNVLEGEFRFLEPLLRNGE